MNLIKLPKRQGGFTLIELLVVIGILAILLAIVLIAINPAKHFSDANDTQRRSDVNAILNAVHQYMAANKGVPPGGITATAKTITDTVGATNIDLCDNVLVPTYLADLPIDPQTGTRSASPCTGANYDTQYTISASATNNRITVTAPDAEVGTISVTR